MAAAHIMIGAAEVTAEEALASLKSSSSLQLSGSAILALGILVAKEDSATSTLSDELPSIKEALGKAGIKFV